MKIVVTFDDGKTQEMECEHAVVLTQAKVDGTGKAQRTQLLAGNVAAMFNLVTEAGSYLLKKILHGPDCECDEKKEVQS